MTSIPRFSNFSKKQSKQIQLTLKQHTFELHGSTYTWIIIFLIQYSTRNIFPLPYNFLTFFSLAYFIVRIQYIMHITFKICVSQLFVVGKVSFQSIGLFGGVKNYTWSFLTAWELAPLTSSPHSSMVNCC